MAWNVLPVTFWREHFALSIHLHWERFFPNNSRTLCPRDSGVGGVRPNLGALNTPVMSASFYDLPFPRYNQFKSKNAHISATESPRESWMVLLESGYMKMGGFVRFSRQSTLHLIFLWFFENILNRGFKGGSHPLNSNYVLCVQPSHFQLISVNIYVFFTLLHKHNNKYINS